MKKLLSLIFIALCCLTALQAQEHKTQDNKYNSVTYQSLPPLSIGGTQGVSAPYAGTIDGKIIVAGGCNFPDTPAAEGGTKKFYADIHLYDGKS